jgi:hypothetical protein
MFHFSVDNDEPLPLAFLLFFSEDVLDVVVVICSSGTDGVDLLRRISLASINLFVSWSVIIADISSWEKPFSHFFFSDDMADKEAAGRVVLDEDEDAACSGGQTLTLLETFSHQVAGHGAIIKAKGGRICKPLVKRELWFYRNLVRSGSRPSLLLPFVPQWFGCFHITKDELLKVVHATHMGEGHEVVTWSEKVYHDLEHHLTAEPPGEVHRTEAISEYYFILNFLVLMVLSLLSLFIVFARYYYYLLLLFTIALFPSCADYIVLGDLTAAYSRPCLMDIKMGARQYGDDATPKKVEYEKLKVRPSPPF